MSPRYFSELDSTIVLPWTFRSGHNLFSLPICILWNFNTLMVNFSSSIKVFTVVFRWRDLREHFWIPRMSSTICRGGQWTTPYSRFGSLYINFSSWYTLMCFWHSEFIGTHGYIGTSLVDHTGFNGGLVSLFERPCLFFSPFISKC